MTPESMPREIIERIKRLASVGDTFQTMTREGLITLCNMALRAETAERELSQARDAALEEAAKVCDRIANVNERQAEQSALGSLPQHRLTAASRAADECAAALRAMKATEGEKR